MFNGSSGTTYQSTEIGNDGFWPDLNAGEFEKRRAIPADLDSDAIALAIAAAVGQVNLELEGVKASYQSQGIAQATAVTGLPQVGNKSLLVILYEKAVFARAKAELVPEFATITTREAGDRLAESEDAITRRLLAESQQHIRTIKGKSRCGVALL